MIHRINVFFLSLVIALSPIILINNANAASLGGWTLGGGVAQGASTVYNGTKNVLINGKNVVQKGVATVTPTVTGVAKVLGRGVAGYALSVAVEQLLGAVDWVLDPANNQIKYTSPDQPLPTFKYIWFWNGSPPSTPGLSYLIGATPQAACSALASLYNETFSHVSNLTITSESKGSAQCNFSSGSYQYVKIYPNPTYDPASEKEEKTIPLDVVAAQVISNAEGNTDKKAGAQVATTAAAADIVSEAESDNVKARPIVKQLEASAETATDETATGESVPKDPTAPDAAKPVDITLKFPIFCSWAPTVCQAASVVISFPTLVTEWWETANTKADGWANSISQAWTFVKDWVKTEEPVERQTKVDIEPSAEPEINNNYLQWNAYCPFTAKSDDISINGETSALSSDLTSWCTMASEIKPFVLLAGALASLMIVSGVGLGRSED